MRYFPLSNSDRDEIKKFLGIQEIKELFSDLPKDKSYYPLDMLPAALPENELIEAFRNLAKKNSYHEYLSFVGGGAYNHFIPEVVNYLSAKGEFLTPYTPYQPEVSQGSLQAMFEYQTMMTQLTGMDISNSSLYDGGTAAAEGILLVMRKSKKSQFLMAETLHPEYIEIIKTYVQNLDSEYQIVACDQATGKVNLTDLETKINQNTAGFIFQSPNFFGVVEESDLISELLHERDSYSVQVITEAMSLAFLKPPAENGVDIAVGEAQSFGLPLGFGGPYLGFITARQEFLRQMPGRIVGETKDSKGRRGYVLTLSTREQHIKREKATSNICTNQAWCAVRAAIYLATMGKNGLEEIGKANHLNTAYFVNAVHSIPHTNIRYKNDFYNEVVLELKNRSASDYIQFLKQKKILPGLPLNWFFPELKNSLLINFTEAHKKEDIDMLIQAIGEIQ
jgi:glycine dehydrogenase subunit 1